MKASLRAFVCFAALCSLGAAGQIDDDAEMSCASSEGCASAKSPSVLQASSQKSQVEVEIPSDEPVKKKLKYFKHSFDHPDHDVYQEAKFPGLLQELAEVKGMSQQRVGLRLNKALSTLRLEQDLSKLSDDHYLDYNRDLTHNENCYKTFEHFAKVFDLSETLSREEDAMFGQRFCEDVVKALTDAGGSISGVDWKHLIATRLQAEKPAVYEAMIAKVNNASAGMRAAIQDWLLNMSAEDMNRRLGDSASNTTEDQHEEAAAALIQVRGRAPASFDARDKWPGCKEVFSRVRDQGNCGSCWAFAAGQIVDHRLCVHANGKYGKNDAVSAGYVAWCYDYFKHGGCNGGDAAHGIRSIGKDGVPSGLGASGCVPYDLNGNARNHFGGGGDQSQSCPTSCPNSNYAKSLPDDTWIPKGYERAVQYTNTDTAKQTAKEAIYAGGPVGFSLYCNSAWSSYSSGVYNPGCFLRSNHAVLAIGYDSTTFLGVNSYGPSWGMNGRFKIADCAPNRYYYPETLNSDAVFPVGSGSGGGSSGGGGSPTPSSPTPSGGGGSPTPSGGGGGGSSGAKDDTCQYSSDGECDDPTYCAEGTDCTDCGGCGSNSPPRRRRAPTSNDDNDDSCQYSKDGECDDPTYCGVGTDCTDCGTCGGGGGGSPSPTPSTSPSPSPSTSPSPSPSTSPSPSPSPSPSTIPTALPTPIFQEAERLSAKVAADAKALETDTECLEKLLKGQSCGDSRGRSRGGSSGTA